MKLKHVGIIVVSVLAMSSAAVSAAEGDESVTTTVNGGVIHFKGEVVNAACAIDSESMNQTVELGQIETGCVWHGYAHPRNSPMFISLLMKNGLYFGAV